MDAATERFIRYVLSWDQQISLIMMRTTIGAIVYIVAAQLNLFGTGKRAKEQRNQMSGKINELIIKHEQKKEVIKNLAERLDTSNNTIQQLIVEAGQKNKDAENLIRENGLP